MHEFFFRIVIIACIVQFELCSERFQYRSFTLFLQLVSVSIFEQIKCVTKRKSCSGYVLYFPYSTGILEQVPRLMLDSVFCSKFS